MLQVGDPLNRRGVPHPLRLAAIADHHRDDIQLPVVPVPLQRVAAKLGATAAWALAEYGFRGVLAPSFNPIYIMADSGARGSKLTT